MMRTLSVKILVCLLFLVLSLEGLKAVEQSRGGEIKKPVADRIIVGLENFRLLVYSKKRIIFNYPVAIGADTGPTPTGRFEVTSRLKHPWYTPNDEPNRKPGHPKNPLGTRWIGISKPHYGLHGTNEPEAIGTRNSEGCIRLYNPQIERLYRHVPKGTPVLIKKRIPLNTLNLKTVRSSLEPREETVENS